MKKTHEEIVARLTPQIQEIWLDVDGVMTRQQDLTIYDIGNPSHPAFERRDGIQSLRLVPCDEYGHPLENVVEYFAGTIGEPIMEGYRFDTRDGRMIETAVKAGLHIFFISGRNSLCVAKRAVNLGAVPFLGEKDKVTAIERETKHSWNEILFIGDGFQDVGALSKAALSVCPADGSPEAKDAAVWVTETRGGEGVVHEVLHALFKIRGIKPE